MFFYVFFIGASVGSSSTCAHHTCSVMVSYSPPSSSPHLGRIVYFALLPVLDKSSISYPYPVNFFLNTVPSFLFFTGFLIVLFLWYAFCSAALRLLLIGACISRSLLDDIGFPAIYHSTTNA